MDLIRRIVDRSVFGRRGLRRDGKGHFDTKGDLRSAGFSVLTSFELFKTRSVEVLRIGDGHYKGEKRCFPSATWSNK